MKEPSDQHELGSKGERCKVCGDVAYERTYGFSICNACKAFVLHSLRSNTIHEPCRRNKQCINSLSIIKDCPCCRLRACIILQMDPYYETRRMMNNALRESFPYHPCPTCISNASSDSKGLNRDDSLKMPSDENVDDASAVFSFQGYPPCIVCGEPTIRYYYSVPTCGACGKFFSHQVKSKTAHKKCLNNQQCIITKITRRHCPCCRLKKCLAVGMDPVKATTSKEINYDTIANYEPIEWFVLLSCKTCESKTIEYINRTMKNFKDVFTQAKENSNISLASSSREIRNDCVQRYVEHEYNCLKSLDSTPKPSIPDDTLKETNFNHSGPTSFLNDEFGYISNNSPYSDGSGRLSIYASSQSVATVENHGHISFEEGLQVRSMEKSAVSSSGSHIEVIKDQRLNLSSYFTLSSSQPPHVCERISAVDISEKNAMDKKDNDDLGSIDMTLFSDLMQENTIHYPKV